MNWLEQESESKKESSRNDKDKLKAPSKGSPRTGKSDPGGLFSNLFAKFKDKTQKYMKEKDGIIDELEKSHTQTGAKIGELDKKIRFNLHDREKNYVKLLHHQTVSDKVQAQEEEVKKLNELLESLMCTVRALEQQANQNTVEVGKTGFSNTILRTKQIHPD